MKKIILAITLFIPAIVYAHEGHDHNAPQMLQAPKGGVIKSLEKTNVEVLSRGNEIKIYLYDKDLKPQNVSGYKVIAKAEYPRSKKSDEITLHPKESFFEGAYDAKGLHRYTLLLLVVDPKTGHQDKLNFTIEPRK